ncbi:MAG: ribosome silencing factor [Pseudomonadota bacterium]
MSPPAKRPTPKTAKTTITTSARSQAATAKRIQQRAQTIITTLETHKAETITQIDMRHTSIMDVMIIATGTSTTHLGALRDHVLRRLKRYRKAPPTRLEGNGTRWLVLDMGDIVLHLFTAEMRALYDLEKLWQKVDPVDSL